MIAKSSLQKSAKGLASSIAAIGVLAGVGLASSPAQAAYLQLTANPSHIGDSPESVGGTTAPEYWNNEQEGYDNAIIEAIGKPGEKVKIHLDYLGDGTARLRNLFQWNGATLFDGITPNVCTPPNPNCWGGPYTDTASFLVTLDNTGTYKLPFQYIANAGSSPVTVVNGDDDPSINNPHYFAVPGDGNDASYPFDVDQPTLAGGESISNLKLVGLGLSDRPREQTDNDASDSNVKITIRAVPEPTFLLGLLAVGSLGAAIKRKKQQPERV